jgi:hypothetical protein
VKGWITTQHRVSVSCEIVAVSPVTISLIKSTDYCFDESTLFLHTLPRCTISYLANAIISGPDGRGSSRPHQTVEQSPGQYEARQATQQAAHPEIEWAPEIPTRIEGGKSGRGGCRAYPEEVEQDVGGDAEDEVEQEAKVRFEAEDAGCDSEERGREALEIRECLIA